MFNGLYVDEFDGNWYVFHEDEPGVVVAGGFATEDAACAWLRTNAQNSDDGQTFHRGVGR